MTRWRVALLLLLLIGVAAPACIPFLRLHRGLEAWSEGSRIGLLASNTLALIAGTLLLALPLGIAAAILLYRTDLPFRKAFRWLILFSLFVPLPVFASGWQTAFGT